MQLTYRRTFIRNVSCFLPVLAFASMSICQADNLYFQGFETDASGWNGTITRTNTAPPGAADGSYYGWAANDPDAYQPGYGTGGYSYFGGVDTPYGTSFTQSIDLYVDVNTAQATNPGTAAFWIDMAPKQNSGASDYAGEHDFAFFYSGNDVVVEGDNNSANQLATITTSGWYQFSMTYAPGATPSDTTSATLSIFDLSGNQVGTSYTGLNDSSVSPPPLTGSNLRGPGYVWLTVWQDGFSDNKLAIDDIQATATPEPATFALLGLGLLFAGLFKIRSVKQKA